MGAFAKSACFPGLCMGLLDVPPPHPSAPGVGASPDGAGQEKPAGSDWAAPSGNWGKSKRVPGQSPLVLPVVGPSPRGHRLLLLLAPGPLTFAIPLPDAANQGMQQPPA